MKTITSLFSKNDLVVFTAKNCSYCKQVKETLTKAKIQYIEKDIKEFETEWHDLISVTNMPVTPAIVYKGANLFPARDFPNAEILIQILQQFNGVTGDINNTIYERLRTFNHHVNLGFNRLDGRLKSIEEKLNTEKKDEHKSND